MLDLDLTRRDFLKTSGSVLMGTLATTTGVLSMLAPSQTWALELTKLNKATGQTLLKAIRHIYPHTSLDDAVYALVVKELDVAASADEAVAKLLTDGVASMNKAADGDWLAADDSLQLATLEEISAGDFFQKLRGTAVVALYNNDMAWAHFGYQGDAWSEGGYLRTWL